MLSGVAESCMCVQGIGFAVASRLASLGASVCLWDSDASMLKESESLLTQKHSGTSISAVQGKLVLLVDSLSRLLT